MQFIESAVREYKLQSRGLPRLLRAKEKPATSPKFQKFLQFQGETSCVKFAKDFKQVYESSKEHQLTITIITDLILPDKTVKKDKTPIFSHTWIEHEDRTYMAFGGQPGAYDVIQFLSNGTYQYHDNPSGIIKKLQNLEEYLSCPILNHKNFIKHLDESLKEVFILGLTETVKQTLRHKVQKNPTFEFNLDNEN